MVLTELCISMFQSLKIRFIIKHKKTLPTQAIDTRENSHEGIIQVDLALLTFTT
jgi:hypothetical protein